jgi:5-methylcytosine-specific restriction endonuclease McrA
MEYVRLEQSKPCTKCGQVLPATSEFFHKHKKAVDGLSQRCKPCRIEDNNIYKANNPDKLRESNRKYNETHREQRAIADKKKPSRQPAYIINYRAKYYERTSERQKKASKEWRKNNPEKFRKQWRQSRARILSVYSEPYLEWEVLSLHGTKCWLCGLEIDLEANRLIGSDGWEQSLHLDHVIPIKQNGPDVLWNVQPTHGVCNLSRPKNGIVYRLL